MKELPILFNGEMVRAILDGRKTQTRRPVKNQKHPHGTWATPNEVAAEFLGGTCAFSPPLGTVGDRLWVRETWTPFHSHGLVALYKADCDTDGSVPYLHSGSGGFGGGVASHKPSRWTPSIHMPRWASRIDLEITRVWVERVQDITEEDAKKEGIVESEIGRLASRVLKNYKMQTRAPAVLQFADLWQSIYGTWDVNPWVWAYEFRRVKP